MKAKLLSLAWVVCALILSTSCSKEELKNETYSIVGTWVYEDTYTSNNESIYESETFVLNSDSTGIYTNVYRESTEVINFNYSIEGNKFSHNMEEAENIFTYSVSETVFILTNEEGAQRNYIRQ